MGHAEDQCVSRETEQDQIVGSNIQIEGSNSQSTNQNTPTVGTTSPTQSQTQAQTLLNTPTTHQTQSTLDPEESSYYYILRILVATLVLYDHLNSNGAFAKNSGVDIKRSIRTIYNFSKQNDWRENLLNTLRFNSLHLRDDNVSDDVKLLLSVK